jgi:hypothetical protein
MKVLFNNIYSRHSIWFIGGSAEGVFICRLVARHRDAAPAFACYAEKLKLEQERRRHGKLSLASNLGPLVAVNSGPSVAACWAR